MLLFDSLLIFSLILTFLNKFVMSRYFGKGAMHDSGINYQNTSQNNSYSTFDPNDPFWNDYNKLGDAYKKQLDPYLNYNYNRGIGDWLGDVFGINTKDDSLRMEMQDRARLALSGLLTDEFQNDYNSQVQQAERMRDAGFNPDISGEAEGEAASGFEQPLPLMDSSSFGAPEEIFGTITDLFGTAIQGLQSVGTFKSLMAQIFKTKKETSGVEITNAKQAYDYAGEYLSAFDPDFSRNYPDVKEPDTDFFNQTIVPSKIAALRELSPGLSDEAYKMIEYAINARKNDPRIYDAWYKGFNSSVEGRAKSISNKEVYGDLSLPDDVIREKNKEMYDFLVETQKITLEANRIAADYNLNHYKNDFDFELFKQKYKLPENLAQSELAQYLKDVAQSHYEEAKAKASKSWLNYLDGLRKSGDPASQYLFHSIVQGGFAPLSSLQFGMTGPMGIGVNGSFGRFIAPGQHYNPVNDLQDMISEAWKKYRNR